MGFQEEAKASLDKYRRENLGIHEKGVFHYRGEDILLGHILPKKYQAQNILSPYREAFFASPYTEIDFHRFFHHLNSSQALCINLFFPLIAENKLSLILRLLGISENKVVEAQFEKESDIEVSSSKKTNFDLYLQLANGVKIYFEIKYTEADFGKAESDASHISKFAQTYQPLLKDNPFIQDEYKNQDAFLKSYQLLRNLVHISNKDFLVLVYPQANLKIHKEAQKAYQNILTEQGRKQFRILLLEELVPETLKDVSLEKLKVHYEEFEEKYLGAGE